jgi:small subunit ribosomal protein S11
MHLSTLIMIQKFGQSTFNKTSSDLWLPTMSGQQVPSEAPDCFCLIHITRTKNNTHATISNLFGIEKTKWVISAGQLSSSLKSKGGRKTKFSQRLVYKTSIEKALGLGYKFAVIHCKGDRGSKTRIYRMFSDALTVLLLKDTTGLAHNGCRPPKMRRI